MTVIGLGLIGGSICQAVRRFLPGVNIRGVDYPEATAYALKRQFIDAGFSPEDLAAACETSDLIFIATPIGQAREILVEIKPYLKPGAIVTDVCSTKANMLSLAEREYARHGRYFIGGHPMAGAEKPGAQHSDPFLFQNALYILTPASFTPAHAIETLAEMIQKFGAHVVLMEAETHDRIAAAVSHLPQILAVGLMNFIAAKNRENPLFLKMAAGGFRDMTRIASSPYSIWRDIIKDNRQKILQEFDEFLAFMQEFRQNMTDDLLEKQFAHAAKSRLSIPMDTRGFLTPHFDVSVEVEDKPGVIAAIANTLAMENINIKDIEVLKVRENEGGTLRLAFASAPIRRQALKLLQGKGFKCREK